MNKLLCTGRQSDGQLVTLTLNVVQAMRLKVLLKKQDYVGHHPDVKKDYKFILKQLKEVK